MLHVFEKGGFDIKKKSDAGVYDLKMMFRESADDESKKSR